ATRVWGGTTSQGKAFGFLDGGRGLVGALFGALGVLIFSLFITGEVSEVSISESRAAFRQVILVCSGIVVIVGLLVWNFMKLDTTVEETIVLKKIELSQVSAVLRLPSVWLLMVIILCAYVGYKITDVFSLYAQDVMLYDQVQSAQVGTFLLFVRPVIGVIIGVLADRTQTTYWLLISFVVAFFGAILFASGLVTASVSGLFFLSILIVAAGVYAARSLYFAVMQRGRIPLVLTGTAVGMISLIGYTPDIFAGPAMGYLLDNSPGLEGHRDVFLMMALFYLIGGIAAWYYFRLYRTTKEEAVKEK
ncbi:MFS transporter, partial [Zeaxanthinibacter enoshimensis]|uniref:MFS transporter n=1 Tax=Zeaxanthinibacter enoshimensis TaxID=392009 RepID=UPI00356337C1